MGYGDRVIRALDGNAPLLWYGSQCDEGMGSKGCRNGRAGTWREGVVVYQRLFSFAWWMMGQSVMVLQIGLSACNN